GAKFRAGTTTAQLVGTDLDGNLVTLEASEIWFKNSAELWATFDLQGLDIGQYDVRVSDTASNEAAVLTDAFTVNNVIPNAARDLDIQLETPSALRPGQPGEVTIRYTNRGETDLVAPLLELATTTADVQLRGANGQVGNTLQALAINDQGPAGILAPGATATITAIFEQQVEPDQAITFTLSQVDPTQSLDLDSFINALRPATGLTESEWNQLWTALQADSTRPTPPIGETGASYNELLAELATHVSLVSDRSSDVIALLDQKLDNTIEQLETQPTPVLDLGDQDSDPAYSPEAPFAQLESQTVEIIRAIDPNDIVGPAGVGAERWITPNDELHYTIRFENLADATAPAQRVQIKQQLDSDLDWLTFRLDGFGWSARYFDIPNNEAVYQTTITETGDPRFQVAVTAFLNIVSGELTWEFQTIDPVTQQPPLDANLGFLWPNLNDSGIGDGFVSYTIKAKESVPSGRLVNARAEIIFDTEQPIITEPIFNTLDSQSPLTNTAVNITQAGPPTEFYVSWADGVDEPGGSTIINYDVYVYVPGQAPELWLSETTLTAGVYIGDANQEYQFVAIARDLAGNEQAIPTIEFNSDIFRTDPPQLYADRLTLQFNQALQLNVLNLYDGQDPTPDAPDLILQDSFGNTVQGSTLWDAATNQLTFVKTGDPFEPGNYALRLYGRDDGFVSTNGLYLDANPNTETAEDSIFFFTIAPHTGPTLLLADFARAAGQPVNTPANIPESGLPILLDNPDAAIRQLSFDFAYDPELLDISAGQLAEQQPDSWQLQTFAIDEQAGIVSVELAGDDPLLAGGLLQLTATVPDSAGAGEATILQLQQIETDIANLHVMADSAIQVVGYLGDVNGSGDYTGLDASLVARAAVGLDTGFDYYGLIDPYILGDINGDGDLTGLDAALIARAAAGLAQPEIPEFG
ncbi:MAG: hypothetical protein AAGF24_14285, partial [Cyanobacteria bacterium P01_H01_bin.121]